MEAPMSIYPLFVHTHATGTYHCSPWKVALEGSFLLTFVAAVNAVEIEGLACLLSNKHHSELHRRIQLFPYLRSLELS